VALTPPAARRTLTEPQPWFGLDARQQVLVRLIHSNPEPWWWRFDGNLAVCVAPPVEPIYHPQ
jgi:hypothetical protein